MHEVNNSDDFLHKNTKRLYLTIALRLYFREFAEMKRRFEQFMVHLKESVGIIFKKWERNVNNKMKCYYR